MEIDLRIAQPFLFFLGIFPREKSSATEASARLFSSQINGTVALHRGGAEIQDKKLEHIFRHLPSPPPVIARLFAARRAIIACHDRRAKVPRFEGEGGGGVRRPERRNSAGKEYLFLRLRDPPRARAREIITRGCAARLPRISLNHSWGKRHPPFRFIDSQTFPLPYHRRD